MRICIVTAQDENIFLNKGLFFLKKKIKNVDFIYVPGFFNLKKIIYYLILLKPREFIYLLSLKVQNILSKKNNNFNKIKDINSFEFIKLIRENKYDLLVSYSCPQIFKKKTLNELKKIQTDVVNFHPALLPKYRGLFGCYYSIKNKEEYVGISFHHINQEIDGGKIIDKFKIKINKHDTVFSLLKKIFLSKKSLNFVLSSILKYKVGGSRKIKRSKVYAYNSTPNFNDLIKFKLNK